ncbi:PqqD family protein [Actinoplanes sp. NPDC048967]
MVAIEEVGEGLHNVVAEHDGASFTTNDVGRCILELCDGNRTEEQIVGIVGRRFGSIRADLVRLDVDRFLRAVVDLGVAIVISSQM